MKVKQAGWAIKIDNKIITQNPPKIPIGAELFMVFPKRNKYACVAKFNETGLIDKKGKLVKVKIIEV